MSKPSGLTRDEVSDIVWLTIYWEHMAVSSPGRVWTQDGWDWVPRMGDDERRRRTVVWGRWVVALWHCRCRDCRDYRAHLEDTISRPMASEVAGDV